MTGFENHFDRNICRLHQVSGQNNQHKYVDASRELDM
jgi:hypothetical protein